MQRSLACLGNSDVHVSPMVQDLTKALLALLHDCYDRYRYFQIEVFIVSLLWINEGGRAMIGEDGCQAHLTRAERERGIRIFPSTDPLAHCTLSHASQHSHAQDQAGGALLFAMISRRCLNSFVFLGVALGHERGSQPCLFWEIKTDHVFLSAIKKRFPFTRLQYLRDDM